MCDLRRGTYTRPQRGRRTSPMGFRVSPETPDPSARRRHATPVRPPTYRHLTRFRACREEVGGGRPPVPPACNLLHAGVSRSWLSPAIGPRALRDKFTRTGVRIVASAVRVARSWVSWGRCRWPAPPWPHRRPRTWPGRIATPPPPRCSPTSTPPWIGAPRGDARAAGRRDRVPRHLVRPQRRRRDWGSRRSGRGRLPRRWRRSRVGRVPGARGRRGHRRARRRPGDLPGGVAHPHPGAADRLPHRSRGGHPRLAGGTGGPAAW